MYIISYDISDNKRRNKIFKLLKAYGRHCQYSLFECEISEKRYKKLYRELVLLMEGEEQGNIRVYDLCKSCSKNITVIGISDQRTVDDEAGIIFV